MRGLNCYAKLELARSTGLQPLTGGAAPRSATDARPLGTAYVVMQKPTLMRAPVSSMMP